MADRPVNPILLYDGVCGLCNQTVQTVIRRDHEEIFRFAALQSGFARTILQKHGFDPGRLDTLIVVLEYQQAGERLLVKSEAAFYIARRLRMAARMFGILPRFLRDLLYDVVARWRYRIWGKSDTCMVPDARQRSRFIDLDENVTP
ncbi:MAG TPA: DCC1-like thiol-disulfide oxidoreductase family protein [Candidatus Saccharimonadales bacterium]|nr:DCC1-like thiol-disulfide oxidoreductase family protein [Candidatus Saccharimonadales bacterium]